MDQPCPEVTSLTDLMVALRNPIPTPTSTLKLTLSPHFGGGHLTLLVIAVKVRNLGTWKWTYVGVCVQSLCVSRQSSAEYGCLGYLTFSSFLVFCLLLAFLHEQWVTAH